MSDKKFSKRIADVNAFMMTSNVHIDDADRKLVNSYIRAARAFHEAVRSSGHAAAMTALGDTAEIPQEVLQQSRAVYEAQKEALELRNSLLGKVRSIVSGAVHAAT